MSEVEKLLPVNRKVSDRYLKREVLGEGTYGVVYKAIDTKSGQVVAIKKIRLGKHKDGVNFTALREIKLLKELKDPNIIELIECFPHKGNLHLVFEFMETDLEAVIRDRNIFLSPADIKSYIQMTLKGLAFCHKKWVLHRDMKPNNLLIGPNGQLKLADFGLARIFGSPDRRFTHQVFARWYRAPELLFGARQYGPGVDVWAAACIFAELLLRRPFLQGNSDIDQLGKIFAAFGTPKPSQWHDMVYLPDYVEYQYVPGQPFKTLFPMASDDCLDLLFSLKILHKHIFERKNHIHLQIMAQQSEFLFLLPLFLLPLIFFIFKVFKSSKITRLPPGPTSWPVIGNIFQMGEMPHITLTNFAKTYGPFMSLRLGTQCLVVGSSPSAAIEILKNHDRILSGRHVPNAVPSKGSDLEKTSLGWKSECNSGWRYLRTLCRTELFASKVLESQACRREKKVLELVEFLRSKEGQVVNIGELVFATVLNMLSNVLISKDMVNLEKETEDDEMKSLVRGIMEVIAAPNISDFYPILAKLDLQGLRKKYIDFVTKIRSNLEPIVEERRNTRENGSSNQQDFLETLLDNGFTDDRIHQLLMELLSAGSDTSTSTIEWAMAELLKNVEPMKKVQDELEIELNGSDYPKESQLLQMSYVQACVKETLRLHPPAPFLIPHRAIETCQVMSYTIPKDAQIFVNVWDITRDPLIWEEPEMFRPQRFLSSDMDFKGNDFEFFPFGAGRRICPGLPMAAIVIPLVLTSLVHFFDWELPHGKCPAELDMTEKFGVTLQKKEPLLLIPRARE